LDTTQVATIAIGFVLTTLVGGLWASVLQQRSWKEQNRIRREEENEKERRQREDAERQYQIDVLGSFHGRLQEVYREVKRQRRILRAASTPDFARVDYRNAMAEISDQKQEAEQLWNDMKAIADRLPELTTVSVKVEAMEHYLNGVETEWEGTGAIPDDVLKRADLENLERFIAKQSSGKSDFGLFRAPYYAASHDLLEALARRRTGVSAPRT
jgi:hypothetical protein